MLVNWLIDVQKVLPKQIILLSRRASPATSHPRGCTIVKVDPLQSGALEHCKCLKQIIEESDGVEGIFHLAGTLADSMFINMTKEKLNEFINAEEAHRSAAGGGNERTLTKSRLINV